MFKNYLKISLRNLLRYKEYTLINILGLSVGLACCILIVLFVQDELSYDRHHENADRIYRLIDEYNIAGRLERYPSTPFPVAPALQAAFPEIEAITRFWQTYKHKPLIRYGDAEFYEERFFFADSTTFDVFTIPFLEGDPSTALNRPKTVVLTKSSAQKYFGVENPIGKTLVFDRYSFVLQIR